MNYCPECRKTVKEEMMTKLMVIQPKGRPHIIRKMCYDCKAKILKRRKEVAEKMSLAQ